VTKLSVICGSRRGLWIVRLASRSHTNGGTFAGVALRGVESCSFSGNGSSVLRAQSIFLMIRQLISSVVALRDIAIQPEAWASALEVD